MKIESPLFFPILMNRLKKRVDAQSLELLGRFGLSKIHLLYILALYENELGMTLRELSDYLYFDKSNTTRAINQLICEGFVLKKEKENYEIKYQVKLTDKGHDLANEIWDSYVKSNSSILELLTQEEIHALVSVTLKLLKTIDIDHSCE